MNLIREKVNYLKSTAYTVPLLLVYKIKDPGVKNLHELYSPLGALTKAINDLLECNLLGANQKTKDYIFHAKALIHNEIEKSKDKAISKLQYEDIDDFKPFYDKFNICISDEDFFINKFNELVRYAHDQIDVLYDEVCNIYAVTTDILVKPILNDKLMQIGFFEFLEDKYPGITDNQKYQIEEVLLSESSELPNTVSKIIFLHDIGYFKYQSERLTLNQKSEHITKPVETALKIGKNYVKRCLNRIEEDKDIHPSNIKKVKKLLNSKLKFLINSE